MKINKTICCVAATISMMSSSAMALNPLEVQLEDGCPVSVKSNDDSCVPNQPDVLNEACRTNNGPVRWDSSRTIETVGTKPGSPGAFTSCHQAGSYYQCVIAGNQGDRVEYFVTLADPDCEPLDPVIIIK